jgi:hypothetical protein
MTFRFRNIIANVMAMEKEREAMPNMKNSMRFFHGAMSFLQKSWAQKGMTFR